MKTSIGDVIETTFGDESILGEVILKNGKHYFLNNGMEKPIEDIEKYEIVGHMSSNEPEYI